MAYTTELPYAGIKRFAGYLKDGTVRDNIQQAAYDAHDIQGYLQYSFIGLPPAMADSLPGASAAREGALNLTSSGDLETLRTLAPLQDLTKEHLVGGDVNMTSFSSTSGQPGKLDINSIFTLFQNLVAMLKALGII